MQGKAAPDCPPVVGRSNQTLSRKLNHGKKNFVNNFMKQISAMIINGRKKHPKFQIIDIFDIF